MKWLIWILVSLWCSSTPAAIIDFERIDEVAPFEGMSISNQFQKQFGVSFRRAAGASEPWPVIARIGSPRIAFDRGGSTDVDTPRLASFGYFFLTDNVGTGAGSSPLILDYAAPVSQAAGYIIDIDQNEQVSVSAYGDATTTNALETRVIAAGDPSTGDGVATLWSFNRPSRDILRIEISPNGNPVGYDQFSSNYVPPPATPASLQVRMHPGITITGEIRRAYRIDYADRLDRLPGSTNWHGLTTIILPESPYLFIDHSPASSPERYYRCVGLP